MPALSARASPLYAHQNVAAGVALLCTTQCAATLAHTWSVTQIGIEPFIYFLSRLPSYLSQFGAVSEAVAPVRAHTHSGSNQPRGGDASLVENKCLTIQPKGMRQICALAFGEVR
jgi:hypothetical protein